MSVCVCSFFLKKLFINIYDFYHRGNRQFDVVVKRSVKTKTIAVKHTTKNRNGNNVNEAPKLVSIVGFMQHAQEPINAIRF